MAKEFGEAKGKWKNPRKKFVSDIMADRADKYGVVLSCHVKCQLLQFNVPLNSLSYKKNKKPLDVRYSHSD